MSEVWWKELRESEPEQWERLTKRKDARNNCALMAIFLERNDVTVTNVEEEPHTGEGCIVQFQREDMRAKGRLSDITIYDDNPESVGGGLSVPKVLAPEKKDQFIGLGCDAIIGSSIVGESGPSIRLPDILYLNGCPIKNKKLA